MRKLHCAFCVSTILAALFACCLSGGAQAADRPNILWIIGENISLDLGCYGAKLVGTPNLDRLAREGMLYTRVFATSPVCAPSRSAFMTGMYQTTTGTHNMRSHRDDDFRLPPGARPLTHRLQGAGYHTFNIVRIGGRVVGTGKLDLNFVNEGGIFQGDKWSDLKKNQPFYAQVNLPEVEYDIYDRKCRFKKRVPWVGEAEHPKIATPENVQVPPYYPDHPVVRREWARFLNSVSGMDLRVGTILRQLRREGLLESTVIFFFADNGRLEPRGIHYCYESGLHVPLIVRWPRRFPPPPGYVPGGKSDRLISLLDLTATTLAAAGLPVPPLMQSRVFLGHKADPPRKFVFAARDRIDETVNRIRAVHDGRYHYIRNFMPEQSLVALNRYREKCMLILQVMRKLHREGKLSGPPLRFMAQRLPPEELYDTAVDPYELVNLAGSERPEHRAALERLRAALEVWMCETKDLGAIPEPPEVVAKFEKEMEAWFGNPSGISRN